MKEKKKKGRSFDTASLNYSLEIITWPIKREMGRRVRPSRIYRSTINFKPCICNRSRIEIRTFLSFVRKREKIQKIYFSLSPIESFLPEEDFSRKRYRKKCIQLRGLDRLNNNWPPLSVVSRAKLYWNWIRNLGTFPQMRRGLCPPPSFSTPSRNATLLERETSRQAKGQILILDGLSLDLSAIPLRPRLGCCSSSLAIARGEVARFRLNVTLPVALTFPFVRMGRPPLPIIDCFGVRSFLLAVLQEDRREGEGKSLVRNEILQGVARGFFLFLFSKASRIAEGLLSCNKGVERGCSRFFLFAREKDLVYGRLI